jgi:dethiobiotin synthetase
MNYFITGTDTGVGKTLVSCALLHAFAGQGRRVAGMKPVAAGCDADGMNEDVRQLQAAGNVQAARELVNPYCFRPAIAPHIAAQQAGVRIELGRIREACHELASRADVVIVEGVGGFEVPLNDAQDTADLARELGLPVILVVGMRLGCISHALLTVRAIGDYGLECAGWVANVLDANMAALPDTVAALRQRIGAPLLGVVQRQTQADARAVAGQLNVGLLGKG